MSGEVVTNRVFDEIPLGAAAELSRTLAREDVELLAWLSGHVDPYMLDGDRAAIVNGDASGYSAGAESLIATVLGTKLPGPGMRIVEQNLHYTGTIRVGDTLTARVKAREKRDDSREIVFDCECRNQERQALVTGMVTVVAPTERINYAVSVPPELALRRSDEFHKLLRACQKNSPIRCGIVHPCGRGSLAATLEATRLEIIAPVLIGPQAKIQAIATQEGIELQGIPIVDVPHSHAAATKAVEMASAGELEALMKGNIQTGELLAAVVPSQAGLRTARRISHVCALDVPSHSKILLLTDAAVNINPSLEQKADMVQNAIDLAHVIGIGEPKVAILSAIETVNPKVKSTLDAAALCKMADRGQITGGIVDGPLAFDNAISVEAARKKNIVSPVAGQADILVAPDIEAANMLVKQFVYMAGADSAGIVMGARVPIVLTSRADSVRTRLASIAVANLVVHAQRAKSK